MLLTKDVRGIASITPAWAGQTVVCIATGPSLTPEQVEACRGRAKVIAINDAYRLAPWADLIYFCDPKWHGWHKDRPEFKALAGQKCTLRSGRDWPPEDAGIFALEHDGALGLSLKPTKLRTGTNSGHQALNIAVLSGAKTILLLGYDFKAGAKGRKHFFGDHPDGTQPPYEMNLRHMKTVVEPAKQHGVRIVNCTPGSAIDCFDSGDIKELLAPQRERTAA